MLTMVIRILPIVGYVPVESGACDLAMPDNSGSFATEISRHVWETRYRHGDERSVADSLRRVARALASAEGGAAAQWEGRFFGLMRDLRFLPGGRILAGAGTGRRVTLFNCFVMGVIEDSIPGIFRALQQGAVTMQQGGGVGYDFSTLRPGGTKAVGAGTTASGPVSFMHVWDAMCATMLSTGVRRGAMMATLRCDHPDIEQFIDAKRRSGVLRHFNLSVQITDDFIVAVRRGTDWPLVFPGAEEGGEGVDRLWPGHDRPVRCRVHRRVDARALWRRILSAAYDAGEPGVLFVDRINRMDNLSYCERITATNPCGEVPLPPFGACNLGSLNLTSFVTDPFTDKARLDEGALAEAAGVAVRMLDNVITISGFPLPEQAESARASRRIGLGVMGLADALILLGLRYDSEAARAAAGRAMAVICHAAYRASVELARERGAFPLFRADDYLARPFITTLPVDIRRGIAATGIRNSHLTAIAPTGTISLLAGHVSSGLEPARGPRVERNILQEGGAWRPFALENHAARLWREGGMPGLPPAFVGAEEVGPEEQLMMQAALQPCVDNAISKTVAIPADYPFDLFGTVYDMAYDLGLKGCTAYRPNAVRGPVVSVPVADPPDSPSGRPHP